MAVWSNDHNVDPVGACVGARGARVRMVVTELRGEKIDIVPFSEDQADFVAKALSPAKVKEVRIHEDTGVAEVIVPDFQLSLAIGREGQNARLAARLTGWRVDIKSETQRAEEDAGIFRNDERYEREEGVEYAEGEWVPNAETGELEWHAADGTVVSAQEWAAADSEGTDEAEGTKGAETGEAATGEEVEAAPTDATPEEAAQATEEAAEAALDEEAVIEANLDPVQDAFDAEDAERAEAQDAEPEESAGEA
jgi:N utilization substance protein A